MRLFVHDFGGYPFPIELSRALARRGHTVLHGYCASLQTTPTGPLAPRPDDAPSLTIEPIRLARPLEKYRFVTRWRQENEYGRLLQRTVHRFQPEVVLSGNTPLDAQRALQRACRATGSRVVYWVQDLLGVAADRILRRRLPGVGHLVGRYYLGLERRLLHQSDAAVLITEDFRPILHRYGVPDDRLHVVENWAPLDDITPRPRRNAWAERHGLADRRCLLYAGTLALKHNPDLLLQLALHVRDQPDVRVVVVSQGPGADWLREQKTRHGLDNLLLLGFQPFEAMPDVFASADVLVALLEPDAGVFSVPSKVLAYLCAARPVLLAVPPENLAARIVRREAAGLTVPPTDATAFIRAAETLLQDPDRRETMGRNARAYAEQAFDVEDITDTFERVLRDCLQG
ncbi:MAG: glycosyltransferase WbuB [Deltaproteobacteria bacterium]|nr:MAG: glycosyltransferase WbuB [Deltaproteobacteria bacterium]